MAMVMYPINWLSGPPKYKESYSGINRQAIWNNHPKVLALAVLPHCFIFLLRSMTIFDLLRRTEGRAVCADEEGLVRYDSSPRC